MSNLMWVAYLHFKSRVADTEWLATKVPFKPDSARATSLAIGDCITIEIERVE